MSTTTPRAPTAKATASGATRKVASTATIARDGAPDRAAPGRPTTNGGSVRAGTGRQSTNGPNGGLFEEPDYEHEWEISEERQSALRARPWLLAGGILSTVLGLAAIVGLFTLQEPPWWLSFGIGLATGGPIFLFSGVTMISSTKKVFIAKLREQVSSMQIANTLVRTDGEPSMATLLALNRQEMKLYHLLTLEQARRSFRHAQIAFFLGFGVVITCVGVAVVPGIPTDTKLIVGGVGVVSTILSGYITATFSRSHAVSLEQLNRFFVQPVTTSYLLTAERVALKLDGDRRSEMLQQIVAQALRTAAPDTPPPDKSRPQRIRVSAASRTSPAGFPNGDSVRDSASSSPAPSPAPPQT